MSFNRKLPTSTLPQIQPSKLTQGPQAPKLTKSASFPFKELQNLGNGPTNNNTPKPALPLNTQIQKAKKPTLLINNENNSNLGPNILKKQITKPARPAYQKNSLKKLKENKAKEKEKEKEAGPKTGGAVRTLGLQQNQVDLNKKNVKARVPLVANLRLGGKIQAGGEGKNVETAQKKEQVALGNSANMEVETKEVDGVANKQEEQIIQTEKAEEVEKPAKSPFRLSQMSSPKSRLSDDDLELLRQEQGEIVEQKAQVETSETVAPLPIELNVMKAEPTCVNEQAEIEAQLMNLEMPKLDFGLDTSNLLSPQANGLFGMGEENLLSTVTGKEMNMIVEECREKSQGGSGAQHKDDRFVEPVPIKTDRKAPNTEDSIQMHLLMLKNHTNSVLKPKDAEVTKRLSFSPEDLTLTVRKEQFSSDLDLLASNLNTEVKAPSDGMVTESLGNEEEAQKNKAEGEQEKMIEVKSEETGEERDYIKDSGRSKPGKGPKKIKKMKSGLKKLKDLGLLMRTNTKSAASIFEQLKSPGGESESQVEKMLTMPLNTFNVTVSSDVTANAVANFLERGDQMQKSNKEKEVVDYADKLGLNENYLIEKEQDSPISTTFQKSLVAANDLQSSLQTSIQAVQSSFDQTRKNFLALFQNNKVGFENAQLDLGKISRDKVYENKKVSLKKLFHQRTSMKKSLIRSTGKQSKYSLKKFSKADPALSEDSQWLEARRSGRLMVPEAEFSQESVRMALRQELGMLEQSCSHEVDCVLRVLNRQSCVYRFTDTRKKTLVYQGCALLSSGPILYVHSSIKYIADQIQSLSPSLSGACISSLVSKDKTVQILELFKTGQLKILYITPDKMMSEEILSTLSLLNISLLCLDEAHCMPEISSSFRASHHNLYKALKSKLRSIPVLAFVPPITYKTCECLSEMLSISTDNIIPHEFELSSNCELSISRDEEKLRTLVSLLKSPKFKQMRSMIIYTESRKSAEDVAACLLQNGHKTYAYHSGKTEMQKLESLNSFVRSGGGIIVATSNSEIGIDRGLINCVIHYSMPKSLEIYIQEVSSLHDQAVCHLFLHDDDYHKHRQLVLGETIEKEQVELFLSKIFELPRVGREKTVTGSGDLGMIRSKSGTIGDCSRLGIGMHRLSSAVDGFVKRKEPNVNMMRGYGIGLGQMMHEESQNVRLEEDKADPDMVYSVRVGELCQALDLKKEQVMQLFEKFEQSERWLEFQGVVPVNCSVRFTYERIESLMIRSALAKAIVERGKKICGAYKFVVMDMINNLRCSATDIISTLKDLQQEGFINYESNEEAFCFKIVFKPNPQKLRMEVDRIAEKICQRNELNMQKLDFMYAVLKSYSFPTMEHLHKQSKIENAKTSKTTLQNPKTRDIKHNVKPGQGVANGNLGVSTTPTSDSTPTLKLEIKEYSSGNKNKTKMSINQLFERYLNLKDEKIESLWEGQGTIEGELPMAKIQTIRDRSTLMTDMQPLILEFYEDMVANEAKRSKEVMVPIDFEGMSAQIMKRVLKTLQGLSTGPNNKDWKAGRKGNDMFGYNTNIWEKYSKYDPKDLYGAVVEAVSNFITVKSQMRMK